MNLCIRLIWLQNIYSFTLEIFINAELREVKCETSLQETMNVFSIPVMFGMAIAVNNKVIPKNDWNTFLLKKNDNVLIIKASQGG